MRLRERVGDRLAIIAVGGVTTPDDVRARLAAGADLVQGYTGVHLRRPAVAQPAGRGIRMTIEKPLALQAAPAAREHCPTPDFPLRWRAVYLC